MIQGNINNDFIIAYRAYFLHRQLANFWRRCRGVYAQVKTYQVPITNSYPSHCIICHLPLVFLSPHFTFAVLFAFFFVCLFSRQIYCLLVLPCAFYLLASLLTKNLIIWILIHLLIFSKDPIMWHPDPHGAGGLRTSAHDNT